jgi:hypothetical protein
MKVVLNQTEVRVVEYIAALRFKHDRNVNAKATVYGKENAEFREKNSVGGELAFCKYYNIYPDLDPKHFGIADCKLPDGRLVDVKTTSLENGRLLVKSGLKKYSADLYVLMVGVFPNFRFAGSTKKENIISEEHLDRQLHHPAYWIGQDELNKGVM